MAIPSRLARLALVLTCAALFSACATGPADNISLIPSDQVAEQTSKEGLFTQPIKWTHTKPGCQGDCPTIELDSIVFPGQAKLSELVDHALAIMTGVSTHDIQPYGTVAGFQDYFWKTAAARDSVVLSAKTRYRNKFLTVIELSTWQYFTGAAHGISATQFLNWDNAQKRVLGLADILRAGARPAYIAELEKSYQRWLASSPAAQHDRPGYERLWPFQESENFGFSDQGLIVKYDTYQIAPYSSGQPELLIPYRDLTDILRPEFVPQPAR